jgi:hypothetical protein
MSWPEPQPPHNPWPTSGPYQILEGGPPPGRRPPWAWLVVVLAVIFVSAAAAGVILKLVHKVPGHAAPPAASAPGADGRAQAAAIDALLNASGASRTQLGPALNQVEACGDLDSAATTLAQIVSQRDAQVRQGQALAVDRLENGTQLRTTLVQALTSSLRADQSFVKWLDNTKTAGCTGHATHDADYADAQAASADATLNKQSFVALWNPVAARYALPSRTDTGF